MAFIVPMHFDKPNITYLLQNYQSMIKAFCSFFFNNETCIYLFIIVEDVYLQNNFHGLEHERRNSIVNALE